MGLFRRSITLLMMVGVGGIYGCQSFSRVANSQPSQPAESVSVQFSVQKVTTDAKPAVEIKVYNPTSETVTLTFPNVPISCELNLQTDAGTQDLRLGVVDETREVTVEPHQTVSLTTQTADSGTIIFSGTADISVYSGTSSLQTVRVAF